jgi:hypothetical protein
MPLLEPLHVGSFASLRMTGLFYVKTGYSEEIRHSGFRRPWNTGGGSYSDSQYKRPRRGEPCVLPDG